MHLEEGGSVATATLVELEELGERYEMDFEAIVLTRKPVFPLASSLKELRSMRPIPSSGNTSSRGFEDEDRWAEVESYVARLYGAQIRTNIGAVEQARRSTR